MQCLVKAPAGSPSRGGDVIVHVLHKPTELAHFFFYIFFFYYVIVFISVYVAFSTVFDSINSPGNSPLSDSVLLVLPLPHWSFQPCISL